MLHAKLLGLYRRTDYVVDGRVHVAVGRRSRATDAMLTRLGARAGARVTAANRPSRAGPGGGNRGVAHALAVLDTLLLLPAEGRLGGWREEGLFVCGDPRRLARLGRRFRQNALVLVEYGRPARLLFLSA